MNQREISSKQKHVAGAKRDQVTIGWDWPEITQTECQTDGKNNLSWMEWRP